MVGAIPGGGFDAFARLLARHLPRYIPGRPKIIVQNMPGAGSLIAANRIYAKQPGDGLTIVTFASGIVVQALMGDPAAKFDPLKYLWLGDPALAALPRVLWIRGDLPIRSLDDLRKRKEPLAVGATGVGTSIAITGEFGKATAGLFVFLSSEKRNRETLSHRVSCIWYLVSRGRVPGDATRGF